jgi:hypothetical protein
MKSARSASGSRSASARRRADSGCGRWLCPCSSLVIVRSASPERLASSSWDRPAPVRSLRSLSPKPDPSSPCGIPTRLDKNSAYSPGTPLGDLPEPRAGRLPLPARAGPGAAAPDTPVPYRVWHEASALTRQIAGGDADRRQAFVGEMSDRVSWPGAAGHASVGNGVRSSSWAMDSWKGAARAVPARWSGIIHWEQVRSRLWRCGAVAAIWPGAGAARGLAPGLARGVRLMMTALPGSHR